MVTNRSDLRYSYGTWAIADGNLRGSGTIVTDQWHHIVVEHDKRNLRFYVDGKLLHEQKLTAIIMGDNQSHAGLYFLTNVKIRDVKVYIKRLPNELDLD